MCPARLLSGCALAALLLSASSLQARPRAYAEVFGTDTRSDPATDVTRANAAARVHPTADGFTNANQVYAYADGALFEIYTSVGKVTDITLQPGEHLTGSGPVAAGDTARWIIGDTESGSGESRLVHILVKPTQDKLSTNLVINTDRRTYHIELHATGQTYMAAVSWHYPQDELLAIRGKAQAEAEKAQAAPIASAIDPTRLNFAYRIDGDRVAWRPILAFDDGRQVFIELPAGIASSELPPLFVIGPNGSSDLVNYRIKDNFFVVDHIFDVAELRLGDKHSQKVVRIKREEHAGL